MRKLLSAVLLCLALPLANANAGLVEFTFFSNNDFGAQFDGGDLVATGDSNVATGIDDPDGVLSAGGIVSFTLTAAGGADVDLGTTGAGVGTTQIGDGQSLTLQANYSSADFSKFELASVDLGDIGGAGDGANVTFNEGTTVTYLDANDLAGTGFSSTQGTPDIITPDAPLAFASGDTIVFDNAEDQFRFQRITFHIEPVAASIPEPSSLALFGLLGLGVATRRRR